MFKNSRIISSAGVLFGLLLFAGAASANKISGFQMESCGSRKCVKVESPEAWQSVWQGSYAFRSAKLEIFDRASLKLTQTMTSADVYYDVIGEKIFLRKPTGHVKGACYYDLQLETLSCGW